MWELKAADVINFLQNLPLYEKKPSPNGWGWKGPWRSPCPMGPAQIESPRARCQGPCPECFEFSQGYKFHNLSGHPQSKKVPLMLRQSPLCCSCAVYMVSREQELPLFLLGAEFPPWCSEAELRAGGIAGTPSWPAALREPVLLQCFLCWASRYQGHC